MSGNCMLPRNTKDSCEWEKRLAEGSLRGHWGPLTKQSCWMSWEWQHHNEGLYIRICLYCGIWAYLSTLTTMQVKVECELLRDRHILTLLCLHHRELKCQRSEDLTHSDRYSREEVHSLARCWVNSRLLNIMRTKELVVDFRNKEAKTHTHTPAVGLPWVINTSEHH